MCSVLKSFINLKLNMAFVNKITNFWEKGVFTNDVEQKIRSISQSINY
jgi:hypothetical protein